MFYIKYINFGTTNEIHRSEFSGLKNKLAIFLVELK